MSPCYSAGWSANERIVNVTLRGFWTDADVTGFSNSLTPVVRQASGRPFDVIADLSQLSPQSQAVVALLGSVAAGLVEMGLARAVMVSASPLLSMQVRRAMAPIIAHFTVTLDEARAWLADGARC